MKYLRTIDIFGIEPTFYILDKKKYQSIFGGICSVVCFMLIVATSFLFGKDFYLRETPRVVTEKVLTDTYRNITLNDKNFLFAFRLEDDLGNLYKTDLFDYSISYDYYEKDKSGGFDLKQNAFNFSVPCDQLNNIDSKFSDGKKINEYLCLNFTDNKYFGGDWSTNYIQYFSLTVYNKKKLEESALEIKKLLLENQLYFTMYYQEYFFIPRDIDNPLKLRYYSYFYQLSHLSSKLDRFNFRSFYLEDDLGWIFSTKNNIDIVGMNNKVSDFININIDSYETHIAFYSAAFYYQSDYEKSYRSFMKIQELAALVGGFMKMLVAAIQFLLYFYNSFLMNLSLIKVFYDRDDINTQFVTGELNHIEHSPLKNLKNLNKKPKAVAKENPKAHRKGIDEKRPSKLFELSIKAPQTFVRNDDEIAQVADKKLEKNYNISFLKVVFSKICLKQDPYLAKFNEGQTILRNKMDISYYLNLTNQFYYIKHMLMSENQIQALDYVAQRKIPEKFNLEEKKVIQFEHEPVQIKEKQIISYFDERNKNQTLTNIDKILMENLNNNTIKEEQVVNTKYNI